MAGLTGDERLVLDAEINAEIDVRMVTTDFGVTLDARGVCTVSLDDQGRLVEHRPDGSDVVAEQRWPGDTEQHAYEAAQIAARTRAALIEPGCRSSLGPCSPTTRSWT